MTRYRLAIQTSIIALASGLSTQSFGQTIVPGANASPAMAAPAAPASAPKRSRMNPDQASGAEIGDIIVTAQKKNERINDVPLAITAIGGNALQQQGIRDTSDLARLVPSFSAQNSFFGNPIYFIRGVGYLDFAPTVNPAVSVYVDEVPLPFSAMARGAVLDLERVEVLKGPQGTLFGENATGGAINYIAAKPTDMFHAGGDLSYGRFNDVVANAYVSGPVTDNLRIRVAVQGEHQDDYQYSTTRDDTRGQRKFLNGRVLLAWQPTSSLSFSLSAQGWKDRSDTPGVQFVASTPAVPAAFGGNPVTLAALAAGVPAPDNNRAADWDPGSRKARNTGFYQIALRAGLSLSSAVRLTSITAYTRLDVVQPLDPDGLPYRDLFQTETAKAEHVSQELRIDGDAGRLSWMAGVNYEHDKNSDVNVYDQNATSNTLTPFVYSLTRQINNNPRIETYAAFGSLTYKLTDTITARGSLRYTKVDDDHEGCLADGGDGKLAAAINFISTGGFGTPAAPGQCVTLRLATFKPAGLIAQSLDQHNISWRAGLDWKVAPGTLLYANVAKGYKAGGFTSIPAIFDVQLTPITQESLLAYEGGLKTALFKNRAHLDLSVFYYDYRNKQLQGTLEIFPFGNLPTLINIPKSRVYGAEAQLDAALTDYLRAQISGSYINSRVLVDPTNAESFLGTPTSFVGEGFPNTPKYQVNFDLEQRVPLKGGTEAYLGGNVAYRSTTSAGFGRNASKFLHDAFTLPSYTLLDLRAGIRFDRGSKGVELFGRNITDTFYTSYVGGGDFIARTTGLPATYGIRLYIRM